MGKGFKERERISGEGGTLPNGGFWVLGANLRGHFPDRGTTCPFPPSVLLVVSASCASPPPRVGGVCTKCPFPSAHTPQRDRNGTTAATATSK